MRHKHHRKNITLRRNLGFLAAMCCGLGVIVGAGIYVLIGVAAGAAGNALWISFLIAAVVAALTGLSYAELSSIFVKDSGEYDYVRHALGNRLGFLAGYNILLSGLISIPAVALGFAGYLAGVSGLSNLFLIAASLIILLSLINIFGLKESVLVNVVFTVIEVGGLIAIIFMSFGSFGNVNYLEMPNGFFGVLNATSLIFFAYIGFESVIKLTEETKNPRKVIPRALLSALGIATLLYMLVAISAVSVVDWRVLAASKAPLADVATNILGGGAGFLLSLVALAATGGTTLMIILTTSRVLYGFGEELKPLKFLTKIGRKTGTPIVASVIVMILSLSFLLFKRIDIIAELTNFTIFITFALVNLALIILRYKMPKAKRQFTVPLAIGKFPILPLFGFLTSLFMILNLKLFVIISGLIVTAVGIVLGEALNVKNSKLIKKFVR